MTMNTKRRNRKTNANSKGELTKKRDKKKIKKQIKKAFKIEGKLKQDIATMRTLAQDLGPRAGVDAMLGYELDRAFHSFFDINHDYHRTTSQGYVETAKSITTYTLTVSIPAGTWLNLLWCPSAGAVGTAVSPDTANGSFAWLMYSLGGTVLQNPYLTTNSATPANIQNPYYSSTMNVPGIKWRQIGAHMIVTPTSSLLNQAGSGFLYYAPEFYSNQPSSASIAQPVTQSNIDQYHIYRAFNGTEKMIVNAPPNEDETDLIDNAGVRESYSAVGLNISNTGSVTMGYTIVFKEAYEFEPTQSNRNIVSVGSPCMPDLIWPYFTKFVMKNWQKYVLTSFDTYSNYMYDVSYKPQVYEHVRASYGAPTYTNNKPIGGLNPPRNR